MAPELFWVVLEAPAPAQRLCGALVKREEYEGHPPVGMHCPKLVALSSTLWQTLQPSRQCLLSLFTSVTATYLPKSLISQALGTEK